MIDTHAHVHDRAFDDDRPAMLARARDAGVDAIVTVGCDVEDSRRACEAAERYGLAATIGIHPHEAKDAPAEIAAAFDALRERFGARVVAVGETGLDYHYDHSPRDVQREVLRAQLAYARARDLPLIFHQREAHDDFVAALRAGYDAASQRGIVHCFTGSSEEAAVFTGEFGLALGIGGVVTFKTAQPLRDAVRRAGLDAVVLETDCPYLAPIPYRGKRNEPAFVAETARVVAGVLGVDVATVTARSDANARRILALPVAA
ncbi:TatD-related deoxyribonuclease [Vulcanimicrobium alpinum]|uniref:TatD-related deoxyribonuclease n=1 Tax=Vulcanimicrobium alpinum TaxID=3016050 RepID=A0AAN1XS87_UNVUL|nr:TatD family hydrolase [Vulcanimicrobium alpinum]BDE04925.1 TatD-related deoxyribonuclease [Vulcanimicrobium alpinum]